MEVQRCWSTFFVSHSHFCNCALWCLLVHGSHTPVLYVYIYMYKFNRLQACIEQRLSINCCCRPQDCYLCSMTASHGIAVALSTCIRHAQSHAYLYEACPDACKLAGATYSTILYNTPTDPLLYQLVIAGIYIGMYLLYATSKFLCVPQF